MSQTKKYLSKYVLLSLFLPLGLSWSELTFSQIQPLTHEKDNTVCSHVDGKEVCKTIIDTSIKAPAPVASMDVAHGSSDAIPAQAPDNINSATTTSKVTIMPGAISDNMDNSVQSGPIYKYQDANGQWVYSDAPPKNKQGKHGNVTKLDLD
jgi:hypothetical protein